MASNGLKFVAGGVLVAVLAIGGELLWLKHKRAADENIAAPTPVDTFAADKDNLVFVRGEHPMTFKDEKDLKGRTLWISAGDQMVFYPYTAGHIDFAHQQGMLLGAEKILAHDAIEQVAPKDRFNRIPLGDKQVFVIFSKPASPTPDKLYAVPVGTKQAGDYTFETDQIFYYDDPHQLFAYWGPNVWKAIDEHRVIPGMSERQAQTALGQVSVPHGETIGDRDVDFDNQGKPIHITFVHNHATKIEGQ